MPLEDAAERIVGGSARGAVHLCNAYTLALSSRDGQLAETLERGSLNLPDGMPLVWISRHLGIGSLPGRVYGPDLMGRTIELGRSHGTRHYLYGSTGSVLRHLRLEIDRRWPGASIVGVEAPPFGDSLDVFEPSLSRIAESQADVVWVSLGTPKQDLVTQFFAERHEATFVAIGAAFDFIAGTKKQAPAWVQDRGLEWGYRLATEPRRLWKRYLIGNTRFVYHNLRNPPMTEVGVRAR